MLCLVAVTVNPEPVRRPCRLGDAAIPATVFVAPDSSPVVVSCCRLVLLFVGIMLDWRLDLPTCSLGVGGHVCCLLSRTKGKPAGGKPVTPIPSALINGLFGSFVSTPVAPAAKAAIQQWCVWSSVPCRTFPSGPPFSPYCTLCTAARLPAKPAVRRVSPCNEPVGQSATAHFL